MTEKLLKLGGEKAPRETMLQWYEVPRRVDRCQATVMVDDTGVRLKAADFDRAVNSEVPKPVHCHPPLRPSPQALGAPTPEAVALGIPPSGKKSWIVVAWAIGNNEAVKSPANLMILTHILHQLLYPSPAMTFHMADHEANLSTGCPDKSGIDSWHRDLCNYVISAEYAHIIENSRALELRRMKERDTSAVHEYFIAKIQHADGCTHYLCIERFPEDYTPTTTSRQHSASRVSSSMDSLKEHAASDEVSMVSGWPRHDRVLKKVDVTNANITLIDLAIAAWVVRTDNSQYRLLSLVGEKYSKGGWAGIPWHEQRQEQVAVMAGNFHEEHDRVCDEIRLAREQWEAELKEHEQTAMEAGIQKGREEGIEERRKLQAKIDELERAIQRK
ncbi:hypothetical protein BU17DRAFT_71637 [Hysterangium stoloniferum]|nr:hypothetical protein BU17DRAFT_71637 [Hysterangium stoloniferum]